MAKIAAIFVAVAPVTAGGRGKPFAKVEGREVFMRTIELYTHRDHVGQKVMVVGVDDLETMQQRYGAHLGFQGVSVTAGGPDWFGAVGRALEKLKPEYDTVIVHDVCRPAVPYTLLDALDEAAEKVAAVAPVVAIGGSLARVSGGANGGGIGGALDAVVDSVGLFEVQSPQVFRRSVLEEAYAKRAGIKAVDDADLVRQCGVKVLAIAGSTYNVRVDSDEMVKLAGDYLGHMPKPRPKGPITPFDEAQW